MGLINQHSQIPRLDKSITLLKSSSTWTLPPPSPSPVSALGAFPLDVWNAVFTHLLPTDLVTLAQLNSTFYNAVTTSIPWRFYRTLFPTSRRIWALSWDEARDGYHARTAPPTGNEPFTFNLSPTGQLPQDQPFDSLFLGTNRRVVEFFGPSVRHRHDTFLTQTNREAHSCKSWRITSTPQYSMGQVVSVKKVEVNLPHSGHHLRPAGLDIVGTFLFWVDYENRPLPYTLDGKNIRFGEVGENVLWPDWAFDETTDDVSLLQQLFLSWGETRFEFSGQMVCAASSVHSWGNNQILRLFDYETENAHSIPLNAILGDKGPWLGKWSSPWVLPWGFDDDGNLLFKILDTRILNGREVVRCVQTSFNLDSMRTTFSVEILEDIQLLNPWNFQMFSDQCWGYPAKDGEGNIWCILRDLQSGNLIRRVGPLNLAGTRPKDYSCHISMFHVIFQDKCARHRAKSKPAYTPLRIFPIIPISPAIQRQYRLPLSGDNSQMLYELSPPLAHSDPPGFWTFGGEDAAERYLFFQGSTINIEHTILYDDWKKWVVWDSVLREWSFVQCLREGVGEGFYCLFSEIDGDSERVGLDWVRMELP